MSCRATQDGQVMVDNSDTVWSSGKGNGKPLQYSCLGNPMNSMKSQKVMALVSRWPIYYWKAMVFQVGMYGNESRSIKKAKQ